jgi:hypothetical protein
VGLSACFGTIFARAVRVLGARRGKAVVAPGAHIGFLIV